MYETNYTFDLIMRVIKKTSSLQINKEDYSNAQCYQKNGSLTLFNFIGRYLFQLQKLPLKSLPEDLYKN